MADTTSTLDREPVEPLDDPYAWFDAWFAEARASELNDPNAMTLATTTADGHPSARIVLLKALDARGFTFYTNTTSRKGAELAANPLAALLFHWKSRQRQVRVEGHVEAVTEAEADAYFPTRMRISRLGAWASEQSRPLDSRATLAGRVAEMDARYPGEAIPRPPHWSGYRIVPARIEFWQDMPYRLHDRFLFTRASTQEGGDGWTRQRLYP